MRAILCLKEKYDEMMRTYKGEQNQMKDYQDKMAVSWMNLLCED